MSHLTILTEPKGYSVRAIAVLKKLGPVTTWQEARRKPTVLKHTSILVVKLGMKISKRVLDQLPNLKIIGTSTTGLNHIDMGEAKRRGITIASLRGETKFLSTIFPTAEETMGLIIMLVTKLNRYGNNFPDSAHIDSVHDMSIYATMLEHVDRLKETK